MNKNRIALAIISLGLTYCSEPPPVEKVIYQSESYTLTNYKVEQGDYKASVVSPTEIKSNYFNEPRDLKFKFAINGIDNEMGYGVDHSVLLYPDLSGNVVLPIIPFGNQLTQLEKQADKTAFLEPNTKVTFQVDLNPVFDTITKSKVFKGSNEYQIKGISSISVLGSKSPLDWDFSGTENQLKDEDGDGIYSLTITFNPVKVDGNSRKWTLENSIAKYAAFTSDLPLLDALYNLSLDELEKLRTDSGFWDTGAKWSGVWTRDMSYSIVLALAYLDAETAKACLRAKVKNDRIIQDTGTGGSWPISSDRMTWSLAAWEIYAVTGDTNWLNEAFTVISNSAEDDLKNVFSNDSLVYGETSFADWREQSYPRWMQPIDIYTSEAADNGMVHQHTYQILADMAESLGQDSLSARYQTIADYLKENINATFWQEEQGYYAQFTYGSPFPKVSPRAMALAEIFGVLFDIADENKKKQIVSSTPIVEFGIPTIYPQIPNIPAYHNNGIWPFVQAFWNWSAANVKNESVLTQGLASMYRASALFLTNKENMRADNGFDYPTEINSDRQLWSVAGNLAMTYRIFFGMRFEPNGLRLEPVIPQAFAGKKELQNFKYRNADLSIKVDGFGSKVATVKIDGEIQKDAFIPANVSGTHTIEITLDNQSFNQDGIHLVENLYALETPILKETNRGFEWDSINGAVAYEVLRNGLAVDTVEVTNYQTKRESVVANWQVRSLANDQLLNSFYSEPLSKTLPAAEIWIEAERYGTRERVGATGYRGYGFLKLDVDSTKTSDVKMLVYPNNGGDYWLDFRYANGNGPINTENKTGIRSLYVNGEWMGSSIFPQRGTNEWSNWGFSNRIKATLKTGRNEIELRYESYNANMNGEVNGFWLDAMRLVRSE
ncbi:glycogen debranching protein [bacterium]|nr:MAG: glycogen debranching protein [bacterium]